MDISRIRADLGWRPRVSFAQGLGQTVRWYLEHRAWWQAIRSGSYSGERLGLAPKANDKAAGKTAVGGQS